MGVKIKKQKVRREILKKLKAQKEETRIEKSRQIEEKLFNLPVFEQAQIIMFYVSTKSEVDTSNMIKKAIKAGKKIVVPVISHNKADMAVSLVSGRKLELEIGPYGIKQPKAKYLKPISPQQLDLMVVPGVAFDACGRRLGRGKGYYDRFLETKSNKTHTLGLAFKFQIVSDLPYSWHDHPVDQVISA